MAVSWKGALTHRHSQEQSGVRSRTPIPTPQEEPSPRLLNQGAILEVFARIQKLVSGGGQTRVRVQSWWRGELRWARNRVSLASDRRDVSVEITRRIKGASGQSNTNQLDDASLLRVIRAVERDCAFRGKYVIPPSIDLPRPMLPYPEPAIWSDATYNVTAPQRGAVARALTEGAEAKGMFSAGYLEMRAYETMNFAFGVDDTAPPYPETDEANRPKRTVQSGAHTSDEQSAAEDRAYVRYTQAQCSMTVRHPQGAGSGWAGLSSYDWSAIDGGTLADRALQKCLASLDPVAIEPQRYTVILEPQAVAAFVNILVLNMARIDAEAGGGAFKLLFDPSLRLWRSKLGLKVVDERITISHDPMDPALGVRSFEGLTPVTWIEHGILKNLAYTRGYALQQLNENLGKDTRGGMFGATPSFRMSGGSTSTEEMITTTKRGLLVTRVSDLVTLDFNSMLHTGLTRDGLWLIENGKITKAVKNMWFTASPLFVLNQLEQLGSPVPVFRPLDNFLSPIIVPTLKVNDFAFTATVDAI